MSYTSGIVVPPSPNWYSSHVSSVSSDGNLYAYACKNYVVVVNPLTGKIIHHLAGHKKRVTSLCFLASALGHFRHFLVTGSADKTLILWDASTGKPIKAMSGHRSEIKATSSFRREAQGSRSPSFVGDFVSVDKSGLAFTWDLCKAEKPLWKLQLPSSFSGALCTFVCSGLPYAIPSKEEGKEPSLLGQCVCYGTSEGVVGLVDVKSGEVVQNWQPHSREVCQVQSLSLQLGAPGGEGSCKGYLLLMTTSKNGEAKLHVAQTAGSGDDKKNWILPFKPVVNLGSSQKLTSGEEFRNWTSCHLGHFGERGQPLYLTNLKGQVWKWSPGAGGGAAGGVKGLKNQARPHLAYHNRPIFRLDAVHGGCLISCSMDRQVACFNEDKSLRWAVRGYGAHSQYICTSPTTGKLAVGCGDNTIRVYSDTRASEGRQTEWVSMKEEQFLWRGLEKVSFRWMSFHPMQEELIIFVSEAGCLGVYDTALEKVTYMSSQNLGIKCIDWRYQEDHFDDGNDSNWNAVTLFTLHSGKLWAWHKDFKHWGDMHSSKVHHQVNLGSCITDPSHKISAFQWSPCGTYLLLASDSPNMISLCSVQERAQIGNWESGQWHFHPVYTKASSCSDTAITCLRVRQEELGTGEGVSITLFVGHEDGNVWIETIHCFLPSHQEGKELTCLPISSLVLDAHQHCITGIAISPFTSHWATFSHLESCIKVWSDEEEEEEMIGKEENDGAAKGYSCVTLQGHHASVLSVCWSKMNPRCLRSVSEDQAMRAWYIL